MPPTPHGDKLRAVLENAKLPDGDRPRVAATVAKYAEWVKALDAVTGDRATIVREMVRLLNAYRMHIDIDLIFDSDADFLYRQKGQLKLDNTVLEEFLPWLVIKSLGTRLDGKRLLIGPANCFAAVRFESNVGNVRAGGGMTLKSKDQDFAITRKVYVKASHNPDFTEAVQSETAIAYVAAECKTNLDKTMFQEAAATALDLRLAVPGAKYFLLCEWLDMTPISSSTTAIEQVIILRRGKRLGSNVRVNFATAAGRQEAKKTFTEYLTKNPLSESSFAHFVDHLVRIFD